MTAFISHRKVDKGKVTALTDALVAKGADVWLDRDSIVPGHVWDDKIYDAITEASYFVACFSVNTSDEAAFRTTYMHKELLFAIGLSQKRPEGWLIPVLLDACEMPAIPVRDGKTIHGYHWVSVAGNDWRRGVDQLAETIAKLKKANAQARLRGLAERVREARRELARAEARCELDHTISADIQHLKDLYARKALAQQNVDAKRSDYEAEYHRFLATFGEEFHPLGELVSVMEQEKAEAIERYRQEIEQTKKDARPIQWLMAIVVILFFLGGIAVLAIFG